APRRVSAETNHTNHTKMPHIPPFLAAKPQVDDRKSPVSERCRSTGGRRLRLLMLKASIINRKVPGADKSAARESVFQRNARTADAIGSNRARATPGLRDTWIIWRDPQRKITAAYFARTGRKSAGFAARSATLSPLFNRVSSTVASATRTPLRRTDHRFGKRMP